MFIPNNNELMNLGYKYAVKGNFKVETSIDPWSGMPNVSYTVTAFKEKTEAEEYAKTQIWPLSGYPTNVIKLEHIKTPEEYEKERKETNKKRKETEARKAEAQGMTVEEYRKAKAKKAQITRIKREIANLEKELTYKKAYLEKLL